MPSFIDEGSWNLRDTTLNKLVAKVHVETPQGDVGGGRTYVIHTALVKSAIGDSGWDVYTKPTASNNRQFKWEATNETFAQFQAWVNDNTRKSSLRYVHQGIREQDSL